MSNYSFSTDGVNYAIVNDNNIVVKNLPVGVYNMCETKIERSIYLERIGDKFTFSFERFGFDDEFIDYVVKRYKKLNKNMGVLLNGTKGCGKTCTAKVLANELNLPVIIVSSLFDNIGEFIQKIGNSCCFFFDEFDKLCESGYSDNTSILLPIFDGVRSGDAKHVFILTTNELKINKNFISRPGRILYRKSYDSLSVESISKYVEKYLVKKEYYGEIMEEIGRMSIKSIDIIKTLIDEVNDMDVAPHVAMDFLNINVIKYHVICRLDYRPDFVRDDFCLSDFLGGNPYEFCSKQGDEFLTTKNPHNLNVGDRLGKYVVKDMCEGHYLLEDITNKLVYICVFSSVFEFEDFLSTQLKVDSEGKIIRPNVEDGKEPF
ncbi:MAG: AAA family ATPase [Bacteroidales bacterium]|nr:AAA family ATPase [Bacteroidales bacterium]